LEQRPIGGLGIHLIRRFMDGIEYHSDGGKNVLRMRKRLPA
jgi:anti-sigma regulatory factor (Ser/Thr protein kinase)